MKTTLGGERLGSGNKQEISIRNYERSTHDLGYIWRSTMSAGTLVPFINEIALPGDTFDIELDAEVLTPPTIGPLYGSYKMQLDVFQIPLRLYNAGLHMNQIGIGLKMEEVKLPRMLLEAKGLVRGDNLETCQVNPSSIMAYLGIAGLGRPESGDYAKRWFNAVPYLAVWDIYKCYYANKQEEIGMVIHNNMEEYQDTLTSVKWIDENGTPQTVFPFDNAIATQINLTTFSQIWLDFNELTEELNVDRFTFVINGYSIVYYVKARELYNTWSYDYNNNRIIGYGATEYLTNILGNTITTQGYKFNETIDGLSAPKLKTFPLKNIDEMKMKILQHPLSSPFEIDKNSIEPYGLPMNYLNINGLNKYSLTSNQEGLPIKTYQSDLFNNWLDREFIDGGGIGGGANGIAQISAVNIINDKLYIDELNIKKKIYDMLNRIAVSGGTYDDWLDSVYTHDRYKSVESPIYQGGLSKEVIFQEVISNSATENEPLGTIAGRGRLSQKHKGGKMKILIDEPSIIMGIVSLTPRLDYSQGIKWHMNLKTMNDLHKPALDGIGYQNLMSDQLAYFNTTTSENGNISRVVGKVPAWINYMTNVNQNYGNFADRTQQMYMTLNRRYEVDWNGNTPFIKDLTTYIDPSKFNHIFADTRLDAQNFMTQIKIDMIARRKMSAKVIPNL